MSDIERKARELVMAEIPDLTDENFGYRRITVISLHVVMRLLRDALTPPEGYVLVPVEPTEAMQVAGILEWRDATPAGLWAAMLAARPEVSP